MRVRTFKIIQYIIHILVETVQPTEVPTVTNPNVDKQPSLNCITKNTEISMLSTG